MTVPMLKSIEKILNKAAEAKNIELMKTNVENANAIVGELIKELEPKVIPPGLAGGGAGLGGGSEIPSDIL